MQNDFPASLHVLVKEGGSDACMQNATFFVEKVLIRKPAIIFEGRERDPVPGLFSGTIRHGLDSSLHTLRGSRLGPSHGSGPSPRRRTLKSWSSPAHYLFP
ncbi:hypothetical protein CDAR_571331 [Caerostris darwini]|uniref:Uncharacterized protein n=1 Tax=Caerostris darwini TaxID=1538125 RepID=A0AAV4SQQ4_9ARAC|nr:hypothetical protein CDAR_571331 [Caerostris darwini]